MNTEGNKVEHCYVHGLLARAALHGLQIKLGSSPLLVIQAHGSKIATSEERVANWKILVHQWRNEHSFRDELSHHLVFTKNDEEPILFTSARIEADCVEWP